MLCLWKCPKTKADIQLYEGSLPYIIRHTCVVQMIVCVINPQGMDGFLPDHDGDTVQCHGCNAGFPKLQSSRIRRSRNMERGSGWLLWGYDCPYPYCINLLIA